MERRCSSAQLQSNHSGSVKESAWSQKDAKIQATGKWIAELGELDSTLSRKQTSFKACNRIFGGVVLQTLIIFNKASPQLIVAGMYHDVCGGGTGSTQEMTR